MAGKQKQKKSSEEQLIVQDAKPEVKSNKLFTFPKTAQIENSTTVGEYPLRTYEMFRNLFVGIN